MKLHFVSIVIATAAMLGCGSVYRVDGVVVDRKGGAGPDQLLEVNLDTFSVC